MKFKKGDRVVISKKIRAFSHLEDRSGTITRGRKLPNSSYTYDIKTLAGFNDTIHESWLELDIVSDTLLWKALNE